MNVDLLCLTVVLLSSPLLTLCDPLYVLSAPNLLRVGSSENVFVEAQDYDGGDLTVNIMVKNFPTKINELLLKTVTLTRANNFQVLTDIQIPADEQYFERDVEKQYVYLQAQFPSHTLEKVVMVSFQSGYIFVQTDKPIYTPASTVQYRVFSLTPNLHPQSQSGVSVDVMNPQGITVATEKVFPTQGMKSGKYKIPEVASPGIWKVVTRYANTPQKTFTADFEVKEYVLPTFEVTLTPSKSFFYVDDERLTVNITADYLFGKKVKGQAFVVFGVMDGDSKTSIAASLQRVPIVEGKGSADLTKDMITKTFPNINQLVKKSIYVSVSVLTETGSEMVEAHRRGLQVVMSPYTIHFKRTPQFFKPGMPFDVSVYVTNPDQTPAVNVKVEVNPGGVEGRTKANGIAKVTVNSQGDSPTLDITVKTNDPQLGDKQQAVKTMRAHAYKPKAGSNNYLHISIDAAELEIGDQMKVNLNLGKSPAVQNQDFSYVIISKGQLVKAGRYKRRGQSLVSLSLPVTKDMLPSFRFVAYYHVGSDEVVSDSVWVDVKDTCMGKLKLEVMDHEQYGPGDEFSLRISGDPGAKVGLVAVDKGVYVLNGKNRLTQAKIWDVIEKHDTGCTAGSGSDSMGVFYDAGLMFESSTAGGTNIRTTNKCAAPSKRRRRGVRRHQLYNTLVAKYSTHNLRMCCIDGMYLNHLLLYSCEMRARFIIDEKECVKAFLDCCKAYRKQNFDPLDLFLSRSEEDEFEGDQEDVFVRNQFPESWLWEEIKLPACPANQMCDETFFLRNGLFLKDSITTWEITAISLSGGNGICVANPSEIAVKKDFFIDLRMPYSCVQNEQLEIKAILHNYSNQKLKKVHVSFQTSEGVCSSANKKRKHRVTVAVDSMSSKAVPFIIIPMERNDQWILVEAYSSNRNDGVRKNLRVAPEGVLTEVEERAVELNPSKYPDGLQTVSMRSGIPDRRVPNTPASTFITVRGDDITQTVEQAISGDFMGRLIVQPHGGGEQTMIHMTLPLIAAHYLDSTNQWETVGMNRRDEAVNHINTGYQRELTFRKPDGSYAAWIHRPSSTWLTAYVAKIFAMASDFIVIEENVLCSALSWLVRKQQADGTFTETAPVYHSEMVGDVRGKDADASLTAFVLIAMQEGSEICARSLPNLKDSMNRAIQYLTLRVHSLNNPYAVAMTSYALAHANKLNKDILMSHSRKSKSGRLWQVPGKHFHSLEATGYAVLALVKVKDFERAGQAVRWLGKQQTRYGGYSTTQATVMGFQALAEYHIQVKKKDINLNLELSVQERSGHVRWNVVNSNSHITRSQKFDISRSFNITAQGTGVATISVFSLYYALPEEKVSDCEMYDLSVQMERELLVSYQGAIETYRLSIEYIFKDTDRDSTMSIFDIALLTGFKVDERDLTKLSSRKDKYIQNFELDRELSERGSLIVYVDTISHKEREGIAFRIHKMNEVGMLQPAGVTLYEYNSPDKRCVKFYHPQKKDGALNRLCSKSLCQCAEENCSLQRSGHIDEDKREEQACVPEIEYVYKARVKSMDLSQHVDIYNMSIERVLKEGTDMAVEGNVRSFLAHPHCRDFLKLEGGKTYLIMGQTKTLPRIDGRLRYHVGEDTWIEYWPTGDEGQMASYRAKYIGINSLANKLVQFGCTT